MGDDDEPTPAEVIAMKLWRELPEDVPVYLGPPRTLTERLGKETEE